MLLREVDYARPQSVEEAVQLLSTRDNARVLAGGQSLINVMKVRVASPDLVVDIGGIPELREIRSAGGALELGAMVTCAELIASDEVRAARPILGEVAVTIADVQVRNRGTVGGNLCSNDPTNHLPPLVVALGASMTIRGAGGERAVTADEFFEGVFVTAAAPGHVLTRVSVPARQLGQGDGFASLGVGRDGTGIVNVAASVRLNGHIEEARVAIGCVGATPVRATRMEQALAGANTDAGEVRAAAKGLGEALDPPSDVHASADYRRHLAEVLAVRAVCEAIDRATQ
jgi:aerobic carbon-monoxide dehydrogenase medium subunit